MKTDGAGEKKLPWMKFHPREFLADANVAAMSNAAVGVYIKLICHLWWSGPLPADLARLGRMVGESPRSMAKLWPEIEPCLSPGPTEGTWIQKRQEKEREQALQSRQDAAEAGKQRWANVPAKARTEVAQRAAKARWSMQGKSEQPLQADASDPRMRCERDASDREREIETHTPPYPPEGGPSCVRGSAIADPDKGPANDAGAANQPRPEPEPVPPDDDLDSHLQAVWNRLGREIRHRPAEALSDKHREAWGSLLEACESNLAECEETIREYFLCEESKLKGAGWTINLFPFRAAGIIARIRSRKAKRLRPVSAAPAEPEPPVDPEAAKAARERIRAMLKAPAEAAGA